MHVFSSTGRANSPGYGGLPNGPSNGLPGQPSPQANQQFRLMSSVHSRSASSTPPLSPMVNQPSRPGSAPPPATGPQLSSPMYPLSHAFGVHSSPTTPSGPMPTSNQIGAQRQVQSYMSGQHASLSGPPMQPPTGGALTQNFNATSRSGPNQSVRPSPWQASMAGYQPGNASPAGNPGGLAGQPTSLTRPQTSLTGPPTSLTGPPTRLTGPPTRLTGPPTSLTGPPSSLTRPTNLTGPPSSLTGTPTTLNQPQIRPPSTTPTGQMMGSTGQPLMPPMPQSPSVSQGTVYAYMQYIIS